jgi:hypothetical protein
MLGALGLLSVGVAAGSLAAGYALDGRTAWAALIGLGGVLWLVLLLRGSVPAAAAGLIGSAVAAAAGLLLDLGAGWMILGLVGALSAWDLAAFDLWLRDCPTADGARSLEREHLQRLLLTDALGLGLALLTLRARVELRLGLVLLLGLGLMLGLSRAVRYLSRLPE